MWLIKGIRQRDGLCNSLKLQVKIDSPRPRLNQQIHPTGYVSQSCRILLQRLWKWSDVLLLMEWALPVSYVCQLICPSKYDMQLCTDIRRLGIRRLCFYDCLSLELYAEHRIGAACRHEAFQITAKIPEGAVAFFKESRDSFTIADEVKSRLPTTSFSDSMGI